MITSGKRKMFALPGINARILPTDRLGAKSEVGKELHMLDNEVEYGVEDFR